MVGGDGEPLIGEPLVDGATVTAELVDQTRARKITVFKKKRRKDYRRKLGHRQELSVLRITEIAAGGKKASAKAAEKPKAKKAEKAPEEKAEAKAEKPADAKPEAKAEDKPKKAAPKKDASKKTEKAADEPLFTAPEGEPDDLKKISGVGPAIEKKLHALGITKYEQIAKFKKAEIEKVDEVLNFKGRIEREDWVKQAKDLAKDAK